MNDSRYEQAFSETQHSPVIRQLSQVLNNGRPIVDFCVPVNIGFPPPQFMAELHNELADRLKFYPSEPRTLSEKFASFLNLSPKNVLAGNGSTELLYNFLSALEGKRRILTDIPTFGRWTDAPRACGHTVVTVGRQESTGFSIPLDEAIGVAKRHSVDTVLISNPNNPTGHLTTKIQLLQFIEAMKAEVPTIEWFIIDESFLDFSPLRDQASFIQEVAKMDRVIVLKSLGKSFGLHGTRMGVLVAAEKTIDHLRAFVPYWTINGVAEAVIDIIPKYRKILIDSLDETILTTRTMARELAKVPHVRVFPTHANFVYMKVNEKVDPLGLRDHLLQDHGLFVRSCGNKEGSAASYFRVATRPAADVRNLIQALYQNRKPNLTNNFTI